MTANPLLNTRQQTARDLDEYCRWLNSLRWVEASGKPYFVGVRDRSGGGVERFIGR